MAASSIYLADSVCIFRSAGDGRAGVHDWQHAAVAIDFPYTGRARTVYAKCEHLNLTGSKDRMALHILRNARQQRQLLPGDRIAEATSGNAETGGRTGAGRGDFLGL